MATKSEAKVYFRVLVSLFLFVPQSPLFSTKTGLKATTALSIRLPRNAAVRVVAVVVDVSDRSSKMKYTAMVVQCPSTKWTQTSR